MGLFFPELAVERLGGDLSGCCCWASASCWSSCSTLVVRPRLVIYNMTVEQLRPTLANVVTRISIPYARWAGECLVLPRLGVQLHVEPFLAMRNVQLASLEDLSRALPAGGGWSGAWSRA